MLAGFGRAQPITRAAGACVREYQRSFSLALSRSLSLSVSLAVIIYCTPLSIDRVSTRVIYVSILSNLPLVKYLSIHSQIHSLIHSFVHSCSLDRGTMSNMMGRLVGAYRYVQVEALMKTVVPLVLTP